jgi:hypothetical protein
MVSKMADKMSPTSSDDNIDLGPAREARIQEILTKHRGELESHSTQGRANLRASAEAYTTWYKANHAKYDSYVNELIEAIAVSNVNRGTLDDGDVSPIFAQLSALVSHRVMRNFVSDDAKNGVNYALRSAEQELQDTFARQLGITEDAATLRVNAINDIVDRRMKRVIGYNGQHHR